MNIQEAVKLAMFKTNSSEASYPEEYQKLQLRKVHRKIWDMVTSINEDYFWNYRTTNLQAGASEYYIERKWVQDEENPDKIIPGIDKIQKVFLVKDGFSTELVNLSDYEERSGYKGYTVKDNHIVLNRTPTEDIEGGLKIEGTLICRDDIEWTDGEETHVIPENLYFGGHEDLNEMLYNAFELCLEWELWRGKQDFDKANLAKQDYMEYLEEVKRYITERVQTIYYSKMDR